VIRHLALTGLALLALSGCHSAHAPEDFGPLAEEFVYSTLEFSPVSATAAGYHQRPGKNLDEMLDDFSPEALEAQRRFYYGFRERLGKLNPAGWGAEDRADYGIVLDQIELALLELDHVRSYRHNPTLYVESAGNAMFSPYVLEYAPAPVRMRHITARLEKLPSFLVTARRNLEDSPPIWTQVALDENAGNIELIDHTIRAAVPSSLRGAYGRAAAPALEALRAFGAWLKSDLKPASEDAWRLGPDKYREKFRLVLGTERTPDQVLEAAEADLGAVRARMLELAGPLHRKWFPEHGAHADPNVAIREVLGKIALRHALPETYIDEAKRDLEAARTFVRGRGLLPLPPRQNLQVIETPRFLRGIYAVGGFVPAPALEPRLGAFYWITPIPPEWPAERKESKLREYNYYKLNLLTLHEAVPGHYVQAEYANDIDPSSRRLLRAVFGNTPYIEGWAEYATQTMLDAGYLDNSPELRLTFQKEELRVLANAILDIRLHTRGMTGQQAVALMTGQTFQEIEEATAKLQRAQLSSCQLPAYFVGWRGWLRVRDEFHQFVGDEFDLAEFHHWALDEGAVPLSMLGRLLDAKTAGQ
jgi:uncharacterized protein (DUF885 family)